jgi:hypothetical protein
LDAVFTDGLQSVPMGMVDCFNRMRFCDGEELDFRRGSTSALASGDNAGLNGVGVGAKILKSDHD